MRLRSGLGDAFGSRVEAGVVTREMEARLTLTAAKVNLDVLVIYKAKHDKFMSREHKSPRKATLRETLTKKTAQKAVIGPPSIGHPESTPPQKKETKAPDTILNTTHSLLAVVLSVTEDLDHADENLYTVSRARNLWTRGRTLMKSSSKWMLSLTVSFLIKPISACLACVKTFWTS